VAPSPHIPATGAGCTDEALRAANPKADRASGALHAGAAGAQLRMKNPRGAPQAPGRNRLNIARPFGQWRLLPRNPATSC